MVYRKRATMTLPYLTANIPPMPGEIRARLEDFEVEELPAYEPSGSGEHVFAWIEKTDMTTPDAVRAICDELGVDVSQAGWAGLKDKRGVTRQWISLFGQDPDAVAKVEREGVRVLEAARHPHKLRTGHLRGNRFRIRVRQIDTARIDDVRRALSVIEMHGLPNYYGEQRFGRDGDNAGRALRWVRDGEAAPRAGFRRKLEISALQSMLFNQRVADRVQTSTLGKVFEGELVKKHETGGEFVAEDVQETQARADRWELSPTGPIFGSKMRWPTGEARDVEERLLRDAGLTIGHFAAWKRIARGTRRFVRIPVPRIGLEVSEHTALLDFTLPAGSYATILMREILKRDAPTPKSG